ncbi:MAG TPA: YnfA family protein [Chloroflexia bacterium]|nr:YnfA family protein [Chloroflexia bacterium]
MSLFTVLGSLFLFGLAGLAEIGGGWLVWQVVREGASWFWALVGGAVLICYGFIPTLQPVKEFGRVYAAYGGWFIILSLLWGWLIDKQNPDKWDLLGAGFCIIGAVIIIYGPRSA